MKSKKLIIHNLKVIKNSKGDIKKYLDLKILKKFKISEVYFSEIKKNKIKGWNLHKKATCLLSVAFGSVKFQIMDRNFKLVKTIEYIHNSGYFFSSGDDTWHGLELKEIQKERRCIQINYVTFNTDWPVEKSA